MTRPVHFYFIAGEISGDLHAAAVINSIASRMPQARFHGVGGARMAAATAQQHSGITDWTADAAVLGVWEVARKYGWFKERFATIKSQVLALQPDAVVLVDYPGFNLRMMKALRKAGFDRSIIYYISPQVWAWNKGRIPKMAKLLNLMICIFPFEASLYQKHGLETSFVGHPMMDHLPRERVKGLVRSENLVGFFPGSRMREVRKLFPVMLRAARRVRRIMPNLQFEVSAVNEQMEREIRRILKDDPICTVSVGRARQLMQRASLGIVASGTATLEAAYFGLPMSIVYKVSPLTYLLARWLVQVRRIGMVNILANRDIVKEYIQHRANETNIMYEIFRLIGDDGVRLKMVDNLKDVVRKLGRRGASERAAMLIAKTATSPAQRGSE